MRSQLDEIEEGAGGRYIDWLGRARASLDYGVAAFIEKDANSILVGPLALAVNPIDLLLPQFNQMKKYFKSVYCAFPKSRPSCLPVVRP
jgi:phytoene desaturase (3,4-didehydrolycopene-forming)